MDEAERYVWLAAMDGGHVIVTGSPRPATARRTCSRSSAAGAGLRHTRTRNRESAGQPRRRAMLTADEARIGQKNGLVRQWARRATWPRLLACGSVGLRQTFETGPRLSAFLGRSERTGSRELAIARSAAGPAGIGLIDRLRRDVHYVPLRPSTSSKHRRIALIKIKTRMATWTPGQATRAVAADKKAVARSYRGHDERGPCVLAMACRRWDTP